MQDAPTPDDPFDALLPLLPALQRREPAASQAVADALLKQLPGLVRKQFHARFPRLQASMDTDDIVQEVIFPLTLRLLEQPPVSADHFRATVSIIIRRTLIDLVRKEFGPHGWSKNAQLGTPALDEEGTTDHREARDTRIDILHLVAQLSDDEADLIVMRFFLGKEIQEIAGQLSVDRATVRKRLSTILTKLGRRFDP